MSSRFFKVGVMLTLVLAMSWSVKSQEKLSFTWKVGSNSQKNIGFSAEKDKQYTVDWGDGSVLTRTGTGDPQPWRPMGHDYGYGSNNKYYTVTITGIEDCVLLSIGAQKTEISGLDVSECPLFSFICCYDNHIPLSDLYAISEVISDSTNKLLGTQTLATRIKNMGDTIDFSTQAEFGGIATRFVVEKDSSAASPSDYTIADGIITFTNTGCYKIIMTNDAIVSHGLYPAQVIAEFCISDGNADATLANLTVSEGTLTPVFNPIHYDYMVDLRLVGQGSNSLITINATANDPNATVIGNGTKTVSVGENHFVITVIAKNGVDTLNYNINVLRSVGIVETHCNASLRVYPNPAKNQLTIECRDGARPVPTVEIYNVVGQKLLAPITPLRGEQSPFEGGRGMSSSSANSPLEGGLRGATIDISHLANGLYFLKIDNKVVKFIKE